MSSSAPRSKALKAGEFQASPRHEAELRKALGQVDRGEVVELTEEQLRHWEETGEWPASLD